MPGRRSASGELKKLGGYLLTKQMVTDYHAVEAARIGRPCALGVELEREKGLAQAGGCLPEPSTLCLGSIGWGLIVGSVCVPSKNSQRM